MPTVRMVHGSKSLIVGGVQLESIDNWMACDFMGSHFILFLNNTRGLVCGSISAIKYKLTGVIR